MRSEEQRKKAREAQRRFRAKNREHVRALAKLHYDKTREIRWKSTPTGKIKSLIKNARFRAKKLGIEFNLKFEDLILPEKCPALNIPLLYQPNDPLPNRPSLDRVDNNKGYTKENTRVISWRANKLKKHASLSDIEGIFNYMKGGLPRL